MRHYEITIVDLPGTYSLSTDSEDEVIARNYIIYDKPDIIIAVLDASNLERNLYLVTQLMELDVPLVLAMNMSDLAERIGQKIDYKKLSALLQVPIVPTVGTKDLGTRELLEQAVALYETCACSVSTYIEYGEEVTEALAILQEALKDDETLTRDYPARWLMIKLLENDSLVEEVVRSSSAGERILEEARRQRHHLEMHFGDSAGVIIADRRYGFISGACTQALMTSSVEIRHSLSDQIDAFILNKALGFPIFAAVMYVIFKFTFTCSLPLRALFEQFFAFLSQTVSVIMPAGLVQSLVVDGIIGGVGGVLGFFPLILFMFFAIAFFEDSGYMARAAFIMDDIMSRFGLHGKSFLPLMLSTNGCVVPGILATRTLESKHDRLITMMVTPFMICGAKLPVFALFIAAFFPLEYGPRIMFGMYVMSIVLALISAWVLKRFVVKGDQPHFVMELPPYRIPTFKGLALKTWERGRLYLKKAGTIIVMISIIMWALFTFPQYDSGPDEALTPQQAAYMQLKHSAAGIVGQALSPIMRPIGLDWRGGIALTAGFAAKEVIVSTYGTLYSLGESNHEATDSVKDALAADPFWNPLRALVFLIFCLIYVPCLATVAVFYRETGSSFKWTFFLITGTTLLAWIVSFIVYQGGSFLLRL